MFCDWEDVDIFVKVCDTDALVANERRRTLWSTWRGLTVYLGAVNLDSRPGT